MICLGELEIGHGGPVFGLDGYEIGLNVYSSHWGRSRNHQSRYRSFPSLLGYGHKQRRGTAENSSDCADFEVNHSG